MNLQYILLFCVAFVVTKATASDPLGERTCYYSKCKVSESAGVTSCSVEGDPSTLTEQKCAPEWTGQVCRCKKRVIHHVVDGKWTVLEVTRGFDKCQRFFDEELTMHHEVVTLVPDRMKGEYWKCYEDGCNL